MACQSYPRAPRSSPGGPWRRQRHPRRARPACCLPAQRSRLVCATLILDPAERPNGRVQPRCGAQRSSVGCNPLLGGGLAERATRATPERRTLTGPLRPNKSLRSNPPHRRKQHPTDVFGDGAHRNDVLKSVGQGTIHTATPGANGIPIAVIALFDAGEEHEQ